MTPVLLVNSLLAILCVAVLVQSVRVQRSLSALRSSGLPDMVRALDKSTGEARTVLSQLTGALREDTAAGAAVLADGRTVREELTVMVGIANAVAERLSTEVSTARAPRARAGKAAA